MTEANQLPGVQLTKIELTAATPDVVGELMREITRRTLAMVPADVVERIAKELLAGKQALIERSQYGSEKYWSYSEALNRQLASALENKIDQQVRETLAQPEVQQAITQLAQVTLTQVMGSLPEIMAKTYVAQTYRAFKAPFQGPDFTDPMVQTTLETQATLCRVINELRAKGFCC